MAVEISFDIDNTALIRGPRGYSITRVEKISGTHAAGTLDTYRVYIDNGDTDDFEIYNGKDAYTYAVAAGYEGTEAEFAELMGHFAEYYEAAEAAANEILNIAPHIYAAAGNASNSAQDAARSKTAAASSAAEANDAAISAGYYAQNAANSAQNAQAYSNGAGVSASEAESAKNAALDAKEAAALSAQHAAASATAAATSETNAAESERQAGLSKNAAAQSAQNAGQSEFAAQGYAEDAKAASVAIFIAEYGVTTYSELEAAYNSGKTLFAKFNDGVMPFYCKNGGAYYFTQIRQATSLPAECMFIYLGSSGTWSYTLTKLVTYWNGNVTLDGKLTLGAAPTADMDATTKKYVDDGVLKVLPTATASGSTASFDDGADGVPVKSLEADIEPVQDLHGYDVPWPAGGGKNKFFTFLAEGSFVSNGITFTVQEDGQINVRGTATANVFQSIGQFTPQNGVNYILSGCPNGGSTSTYRMTVLTVGYDTGSGLNFTGAGTQLSISIDVYNGQTVDLVFKPMIRLATEADSTFAPYSNICPISGWTGAEVTRTGKNLLHVEFANDTKNGITITGNGDGTYTVNGTATGTAEFASIAVKSEFFAGKILTGCPSGGGSQTYRILQQVQGAPWTYLASDFGNGAVLMNTEYEEIRFVIQIKSGQTVDNLIFKPMVRLASDTDAAYEPYQGETYPIIFPSEAGTVYGGTLDVTNGVLTVDRAMVDLGTLNWGKVNYFSTYDIANQCEHPTSSNIAANAICSIYPVVAQDSLVNKSISIQTDGAIVCNDDTYTDATSFKTAMNGVQFVFELAAHITYHLTPTEVTTLLGQNNIWADTGDVTVTYRQDIGLALNKLNNAILSLGGNI